MKIVSVHYAALVNTGNYENEKIGLTAQIEEGDTVQSVVTALREQTFTHLDQKDKLARRYDLINQVQDLERQVERARAEYEQVSAFMTAQGLKADMPSFPVLRRAIEAAPPDVTETVRIEESEVYEEDEDTNF
jgi:hypothetical protein